ncbi:MAG: ABC transporter permease [Acholeplasmatales bacterium]|jgi:ABC-2 type transport system permease protein|nr:ABC transporter permease [Acholeplasmatales bacterium]
MIKHLFKITLSDKISIFWVLLFPIILGTFFMLAFEGLKNKDNFTSIKVAFVGDVDKSESSLYSIMEDLPYESEQSEVTNMFLLSEVATKEEAEQQLNDKEIKGYIYNDELYIYKNGMSETVIKTVMEIYYKAFDQATALVENTALTYPEAFARVFKENNLFEETGEKTSSLLESYYYSVLGMAIMLASSFSLVGTAFILPNQTEIGKRIAISPQSKIKKLLLILFVNFVIMMSIFILILLYFKFVVGIPFHYPVRVIIITFLGALFALALGFSENILMSKLSFNTKVGINTTIGVFGGFLSGMMFQPMKYFTEKYIPFLKYINPVNLITDGLLSIEQYDHHIRYYINLGCLALFTIILITLSALKFRREKYESL